MANQSVENFKRRLARLPVAAKKAARAEVFAQAQKMAAAMRGVVSVGKTGKLRDSIRVEAGRHELQALVKAGGSATTVAARSGQGSYDYSKGVEFGTSTAGEQPFFWPTYRKRKRPAKQAIGKAVSKAVKAEAGTGNG